MTVSHGRPLLLLISASVVAVSVAASGCKKSTPSAGGDAGALGGAATSAPIDPQGAPQGPSTAESPFGDPFNPPPRPLPPAEAPRDNIDIPTGTVEVPGESAPAAPPPDPFDPVVQAVRASAVGCFAGQPPGEYSARLDVAVSPAGRVTRVDVQSASTSDAAVLKCLEQAASREFPSTADGRKVSIDVRVKG